MGEGELGRERDGWGGIEDGLSGVERERGKGR